MKIAVITDDGETVSQHFGRALHYVVFTVEDGKITGREMRDKVGHGSFSAAGPEEHLHGAEHGLDPAAHDKHTQMASSISDCEVVLCGGMGRGAYYSLQQLNIKPVVTDLREVEAAAQAYLDGSLIDHTELLH
jgi:predicted Fe-Mo cluster-binding NifX family protein